LRLLLRALRWRAAASVATVLLAAVTVLGAVLGPLWTRAGSESVLRDTLTAAEPGQNAALGEAHGIPTTRALAILDRGVAATDLPLHGAPVRGLRLASTITVEGRTTRYRTTLLWREDLCSHITLVSGRCPAGAGEVVLHRQAAARIELHDSTSLEAAVQGERSSSPNLPTTETVVGTYLPNDPSGPYWAGEETAFLAYDVQEEGALDRVPAVLAMPATFDAIAAEHATGEPPIGFATSTRLLDVTSVRLADVPVVTTAVQRAQQALALGSSNALVLEIRDNVTAQFQRAAKDGDELGRASTVVLAQLVLLAGVVLLLVVGGSAAARAPEVAAARLRGLRIRTVLGLAVAEPLALVAVGAPLGGLLAWLLARVMAAGKLVDGTPVAVPAEAYQTLLVAAGAVVVAVLLVCARELGKPVLELWERTSKPPSRGAFGLDLVLVAAGVAAVVACARGGEPWVLLVPVPVSLVIALVGLRALPLAFAPALRRTRGRRGVPAFLAVRQLVRRREGAWLTGLLVVAFGLAATATTAWSVAGRAATVRADTEVGAVRVLAVQPDPQHPDLDLRAAVRAADPGGRQAMAVLEYLPFQSDPGGRYLAVDSTRLAAVARWDDSVVGASVSDVVAAVQRPRELGPSAVVTEEVTRDPLSSLAPNTPRGGVVVTSIDGLQHGVLVRKVVRTLPRALGKGTLVDWDAITTIPSTRIVSLSEVWLSSTDPALRRRLEQQGLQVLATDDAGTHRTLLGRQGPALAVLLSLAAAVVGLLLAAATTLFTVLTSARRRGWELAALGAVGVPARSLRRASRGEALLLLGSGLGLGVAAGATACAFTLPSLPLFSDGGGGITVPLTPGPLAIATLLTVALVLVAVTAGMVGRVLARAADPARLREVQA
jgi:hypothetical protein